MALCMSLDGNAFSDTLKTSAKVDSVVNGKVTILKDAVVVGHSSESEIQMRMPLNYLKADAKFLEENYGGSLMQSLSKIPGIKSTTIGSGESKPLIRGLGANRVLISENGIKHEGQQWGDDHGLEIDQFSVEEVEIVKGPSALMYGSDAIGGVINIKTDMVPIERFGARVNFFARSNNESLGASALLSGRYKNFWYKANATVNNYADYKIPTDSIQYYSYFIKLYKRRLRNTAGKELDGGLTLGYEGDGWRTSLRVSEVNVKSGFFANAHGLEIRLSDIDYDASRRDIDLPYHTVSHTFVSSHSEFNWGNGMLEANLGWQNNRQKEFSEPVSHGYMPTPPDSLERSFRKNIFTSMVHVRQILGINILNMGVCAEYQVNRIGGWGFILPSFEQNAVGSYLTDRITINEGLAISCGLRYDYGYVNIHSYKDWFKTPSLNGDMVYMERSSDFNRRFKSITWSVGVNGRIGDFSLKTNIGKSFRVPIAKELGMDGINYSIFRYEKGNSKLNPEESYQLDAGFLYENKSLIVSFTPYFNYFPNYIYLNPTSEYKEGLQLYYYTQAEVFRCGFETSVEWRFLQNFILRANSEYLYSRQVSGEKKGYTLPMSPPWTSSVEFCYSVSPTSTKKGGFASVEYVIVGDQQEVVPPEEPTPGHRLVNVSLGRSWEIGKNQLRLTFNCNNLFNVKYYDHTSYYRLIGAPAPGRDISMMVVWNF